MHAIARPSSNMWIVTTNYGKDFRLSDYFHKNQVACRTALCNYADTIYMLETLHSNAITPKAPSTVLATAPCADAAVSSPTNGTNAALLVSSPHPPNSPSQ